MSGHTPGPWAAFSDERGHTNIVAVVPKTACVFSLPGRDKKEPDVRLIAAAPDLLEALQAICDEQDARQGYASCETYDKARAAIAKATK